MKIKQRLLGAWTAAALTGLVFLIVWAVSLFSYGIWVDANAAVGDGRPMDYVLLGMGVVLLVAPLIAILVRRRAHH